jgi:hypothetical protein
MKTRGRGSVFVGRSGERRGFGRVGHDCGREEGDGDGLIEDSDALLPGQRRLSRVLEKNQTQSGDINSESSLQDGSEVKADGLEAF